MNVVPDIRRGEARDARPWSGASCAYLAFEPVNDWANVVHILAMCDTLTSLGVRARLLAYPQGGTPPSAEELREQHGLADPPSVTWLPWDRNRWVGRARLSLASARAGRRDDFVYTRKSLPALAALLGGSPRVVLEVHQPDVSRHGRLAFALARHSSRLRVVAISRKLAEIIADDYRLDPSAIIVEHTGTALPIRRDYRPDSAEGRRLRAMYVGTFAPGRGLETIFAMAQRHPDVDFVVVGGTPPGEVPGNVEVRQAVPHGRVAAMLASADVLLMPYTRGVMLPDGNGGTGEFCSPLKMFEYLAAGRSIIASDLPSIAEVLVDGENALLVDELDVDEWCAAMERLAAEPALRSRLARGAADTAAHHTIERRLERILDRVWSGT